MPGAGEERNFPQGQSVGNYGDNPGKNFQAANPGQDGETGSLRGDQRVGPHPCLPPWASSWLIGQLGETSHNEYLVQERILFSDDGHTKLW